jgi:cytochrome c553
MPRRFFTGDEDMSQLEDYLRDLEAEAGGVREHLAELRRGEA